MNIDEARTYVLSIARKNQLGSFTPSQLDIYFQRAQMQIINNLRVNYEWNSLVSDQLSKLVVTQEVFNRGEKFFKPADYLYWVSFFAHTFTNESCGNVTKEWAPVELITQDKLANRMSSTIVKPTTDYPVAINYSDHYLIFPSPGKITLTYVRVPKHPKWGYTTSNDRLVYNPSTSQDLELPDSLHDEICTRVLNYMGLSTRDENLYSATAK